MSRYRTKIWFGISAVLALIVVSTIAANSLLYLSKKRIEQEIWRNFSHQVLIDHIFYIFPNRIVLRNVTLAEKSAESSRTPPRIFFIPKFVLKFSVLEILIKQHFSIRAIILDRPDFQYRQFIRFLQQNSKEILRILNELPLNDIQFKTKGLAIDLNSGDKTVNAHMDFAFTVRGKRVVAAGSLYQVNNASPLRFRLQGQVKPNEGFFFTDLVLERYDFSGKFWGNLSSGYLQVNGFFFWDTLAKTDVGSRSLTKRQRLKNLFGLNKRHQELDPNVYILDIGFRAKVGFPDAEIEAFVFSVNNMPVSIKGDISMDNPVRLDMAASLFPSQYSSKPMQNFQRTDINLAAVFLNNAINTSGKINVSFKDSPEDRMPFETIDVDFRNGVLTSMPQAPLKLYLEEGQVAYQTDGVPHLIRLEDVTASLNFLESRLKMITVKSSFYDGLLDGKVWLDTSQFPLRITSRFNLSNVEANKLDRLVDHFAKIHGRLYSQMHFKNDPDFVLKGSIAIQQGHLKEFEFFKWLADNFALETLRDVPFKKAAANFELDASKVGLYDIDLSSEDVTLEGYFTLKDKLASSKLSLIFSRNLLQESPKFKPIIQRFGEKEAFQFDFQLSGSQDAMNFQWLDSELKQKIQGWIPNFIERKIERNIDKSLQPEPAAPLNQNE